jgi:hypothetical protein
MLSSIVLDVDPEFSFSVILALKHSLSFKAKLTLGSLTLGFSLSITSFFLPFYGFFISIDDLIL